MGLLFIILVGGGLIWVSRKYGYYMETDYYHITNLPFWKVFLDKGRIGEFYTYQYLEKLAGEKKYLFNCYVPKDNGETTEIDVILVHETGIYVFESKNYSGWIFGNEDQKNWTQTLPQGRGRARKTQFLNPIIQNKIHLKWLKLFLKDHPDVPFYSYIVFSDRCKLKDVKLTSFDHHVINRFDILKEVSDNADRVGKKLDHENIMTIYNKLYPLTQVDEAEKVAHIQNIEHKYKKARHKVVWSDDEADN